MGSYLISCIAIYVSLCCIMHKPFIEKKKKKKKKRRSKNLTKLWQMLNWAGIKFGGTHANRQTAKLNSLPNFPAIWYYRYQEVSVCKVFESSLLVCQAHVLAHAFATVIFMCSCVLPSPSLMPRPHLVHKKDQGSQWLVNRNWSTVHVLTNFIHAVVSFFCCKWVWLLCVFSIGCHYLDSQCTVKLVMCISCIFITVSFT